MLSDVPERIHLRSVSVSSDAAPEYFNVCLTDQAMILNGLSFYAIFFCSRSDCYKNETFMLCADALMLHKEKEILEGMVNQLYGPVS